MRVKSAQSTERRLNSSLGATADVTISCNYRSARLWTVMEQWPSSPSSSSSSSSSSSPYSFLYAFFFTWRERERERQRERETETERKRDREKEREREREREGEVWMWSDVFWQFGIWNWKRGGIIVLIMERREKNRKAQHGHPICSTFVNTFPRTVRPLRLSLSLSLSLSLALSLSRSLQTNRGRISSSGRPCRQGLGTQLRTYYTGFHLGSVRLTRPWLWPVPITPSLCCCRIWCDLLWCVAANGVISLQDYIV